MLDAETRFDPGDVLGALRRLGARVVAVLIAAALTFAPGAEFAMAEGPRALTQAADPHAFAARPTLRRFEHGSVFELSLSEPLDYRVFTLSRPQRVVIDLPAVAFHFEGAAPNFAAAPGVNGLRVGRFNPETARLVLDVDDDVTLLDHGRHATPHGATLRLRLRAPAAMLDTGAIAPRAAIMRDPGMAPPRPAPTLDAPETVAIPAPIAPRRPAPAPSPAAKPERATPAPDWFYNRPFVSAPPHRAPTPGKRPRVGAERFAPDMAPAPHKRPKTYVVVIDPGHGGHDPGASYGGMNEKEFVLEVALDLRDALARPGRVDVYLTRDDDRFIRPEDRVVFAERVDADIFISLHADALENDATVQGASVYTLSDEGERRFAKAKKSLFAAESASARAETLKFLARRNSAEARSARFADAILDQLGRAKIKLVKRPHRQMELKVLKTVDFPAVLVELGFLSNVFDRRRFGNPAWKERAVAAMAIATTRWIDALPDARRPQPLIFAAD